MNRLFVSFIVAIGFLALTTALLVWISFQPPHWYSLPDFTNPEVKELADRAEYRFNEELHKIRPEDEIWRIRLGENPINAWLSGRLEGWLTHDQNIELPQEIHDPQVHITDGGIWTYANVEVAEGSPRPLGIKWWIWVDENRVHVEPIAIRLGKLPIPMTLFEEQVAKFQTVLVDITAEIPLLDDRTVVVQHVVLENGAIVLTCQTKLSK
ncbi:MAG: hypothetical protein H8E91_06135 [Planctomycetes bacterium]|nr:hypothetical protein [Planctomycetota bacterium]